MILAANYTAPDTTPDSGCKTHRPRYILQEHTLDGGGTEDPRSSPEGGREGFKCGKCNEHPSQDVFNMISNVIATSGGLWRWTN